MALYKIQIKLKSPLASPLKGDTIWGHVAWGIANHEGDDAVSSFIKDCKENAAFVISSAFPAGTVCRHIPEVGERVENLNLEDYAKIKQQKKVKYESACLYFFGAENADDDALKNPFTENTVTRNTISRTDNTVQEGGLFSVTEYWTEKAASDFDLYVFSSYSASRVTELCKWAFENGFGADASVGRGQIEITKDAVEVKPKLSGQKYMALSPFILPDLNAIKNLRADTFVRSGKIGGSFASSLVPWKKPVVLYDEGAVFECDEKLDYIGCILSDIHSDPRIVQSAIAPVIPIE